MNALCGKILVQKSPGTLRETKIKVDFDKTAHLSQRKITQRELKRTILQVNFSTPKNNVDVDNSWQEIQPITEKLSHENLEKLVNEKDQKLTSNELIRVEKRRKIVN